ncbi:ubiquitin carboxyl-terminal hydrolase 15, partial [Eurytemora carolleeae]|uniref:ubiquitin carboxyl-terminal hydrolase 15 n=1 Tax=Eurytemora carolleeae TaxID=1294199 RepID=UPI000C78DC1D
REYGLFVKHCRVEVYLTELCLALNSDPENKIKMKFSKADTIAYIMNEMRREFNIPETAECRVWSKYTSCYELIEGLSSTYQESGLYPGQTLILEVKGEDGEWPRDKISPIPIEAKTTEKIKIPSPPPAVSLLKENGSTTVQTNKSFNSINGSSSSSSYQDGVEAEDGVPGLCGLSNLGNTCFMNSILQGLSNTPAIAEYFENDNYEEDINEENPLGMKGEIARAFGQLIKDIWSGRYKYVVPRNFKTVVGRFAPQFSGYQQQDSQELLTFLLDGLHEDLNRIKKKPYVEMGDTTDRDDREIAREAWENYKRRNDSVILDIFHGLLKSTLVCPQCNKISVTFDPTCYLSLPLPVKKEREIEVFFVSLTPSLAPVQYKVSCPKDGYISDLDTALRHLVQIPEQNKLVIADLYNHRFHKLYTGGDPLSNILEKDDIFVYEVSDPEDSNQVVVPVYLRTRRSGSGYSPSTLFGQPFLVTVPSAVTEEALYDLLLDRMSRYVSRPSPEDQWWKETKEEKGEKMEVNGDSLSENCDLPSSSGAGGSAAQSPATDESPTSEISNGLNIQEEEEEEEDENEGIQNGRMFSFSVINNYGNAQIRDGICDDDGLIRLERKNFLGLDWHLKAKAKFFNEKAAEDFSQDASMHTPTKKQKVDLKECLKLYTSQEKLGADDAWYCPKCKEHQQATKKFDLWMLPEILIISLKRFSYNRYWRDKIDVPVQFPVQVFIQTVSFTHTAYGKNRATGKWYYFDDARVTEAKESDVVSKAAYVLFYQRRSTNSVATHRNIPAAAGSSKAAGFTNGTNGVSSSDEDMEIN